MTTPAADPKPPYADEPPKGLAPIMPGPLPGEPEISLQAATDPARLPIAPVERIGSASPAGEGTIPLAEPHKEARDADADEPAPKPAKNPAPKLADKPMWPVPEETTGRRFLATMAMLGVIGLYAWMLSFYYTGAHGGVDQSGYLMTTRLLVGEYNVGNPLTTAKVATTKPDVAAKVGPAIWQGGETGYVEEVHPQPAAIQQNSNFDWLRNRLSYVPDSPFEFAGRMDIITEPYGPASPDMPATFSVPAKPPIPGKPAEFRVYAKYPFGFSLLAAVGREVVAHWDHSVTVVPAKPIAAGAATASSTLAGPEPTSKPSSPASAIPASAPARPQRTSFDRVGQGIDGMYFINPLCTVLACYFAYFMFRQAVSSFMAIIGVIWLACNPLVLVYANDANSHASSLFCVCMGFWGVLSFLRTQQLWRAWIGGLALGYCCTIRYSEFLLVLPVSFAALINFRFTWKKSLGSLSLMVAWAIPVVALAFVCYIAFGSPSKTGYTYCNEDTGFGWKYLTGSWEDREVTGNWETLVTQINRTGLFIMWPLALAGLMGLIGSAWRLGGIIALWVVPSMTLYLLYYWAPGGDTTTGYLRFYVTIMPGLIFAGIWLLDRALSFIPGEKYAGLAVGTVLALSLLVIVAFFADGGPETIDGGLKKMIGGFIGQTPGALWRLVSQSKFGLLCGGIIVAALAGMWIFDREIIAKRLGVALGAGAITALGCAINIETITTAVERNFANQTALRVTVDNLREVLPRGAVIFSDDALLQQLDCIGGWKLYDTNVFNTAMYNQSMTKLAQRNTPEHLDDPDPLQVERSEFYKELLLMPSTVASISLGPRTQANIMQLEKAVIDKNLDQGRRVTFLILADPGDAGVAGGGGGGFAAGGRISIPDGYETRVVRKWTISAPPTSAVLGGAAAAFGAPAGRGGGGRGRGGRGAAAPPAGAAAAQASTTARQGPTYILYEVVKAPRGGT